MDQATRDTLADLLLAWEDAFREGRDVPAGELARDTPELIELLDRRIRVLKAMFWLDRPRELVATETESPPGGRLLAGRYRLDQRVAVGGFAEVWRAFDTELRRIAAVKIPKPSRIGMKEAFLAEARRVANLRHPAIVPVYDVGTDGEACFIVSEFIDGGSLADRLARGPLAPAEATRWVAQIAEALAYAHRSGVIHLDIKPANILLNHHGDAVLTDFGIAKSEADRSTLAPSAGTLRYMAPEQLSSGTVGPAADIYSLGVVLHESLAGDTRRPSDAPVVIEGGVAGVPEPTISLALPPRIAKVCRRALSREPADRHPTAAAFATDLKSATMRSSRRVVALSVSAAVMATMLPLVAWVRGPALENPVVVQPRVERVRPAPHPAPVLDAAAGSRAAVVMFRRIADAGPYVVAAHDVVHFSEWQEPPETYVGSVRNDVECSVIYRFDFARPTASARLVAQTRCWDFTTRPGGFGRGASAIDISRDGVTWVVSRDGISESRWGEGWDVDERMPASVLGGTSIWVRARLLTNGSPNSTYSVAQFGRNHEDPSQPAFGIEAELEPEHVSAGSPR